MGNDIRTAFAKAGLISEDKANSLSKKVDEERSKREEHEKQLRDRRREVNEIRRHGGDSLIVNRKGKRLAYFDWYIFGNTPKNKEQLCSHCGEKGLHIEQAIDHLTAKDKELRAANIIPIGATVANSIEAMLLNHKNTAREIGQKGNLLRSFDIRIASLFYPENLKDFVVASSPLYVCIACTRHLMKSLLG